jgi:mono/diheme cytochrome c family protein
MIPRRTPIFISAALSLIVSALATHAAEFDPAATQQFFQAHCISCHGPKKQAGKVRLDQLNLARPAAADADLLSRVSEALMFQVMPPEDEPQPKKVASESVVAWIENVLGADGEQRFSAQEKLRRPENGNYVDHATLFTPPAVRKASTPAAARGSGRPTAAFFTTDATTRNRFRFPTGVRPTPFSTTRTSTPSTNRRRKCSCSKRTWLPTRSWRRSGRDTRRSATLA